MFLFPLLLLASTAVADSVIYDGRAPLSLTSADLDASSGPYLTAVKGSQSASFYTKLLGQAVPPTPLWNRAAKPYLPATIPTEQTISVTIDNSSVFVPGSGPQFGFRRTDLIAQANGSPSALDSVMEVGATLFHFSIQADPTRPLIFSHEYQPVFIEPSDGSHVFGVQIGSPFTNPTGQLPINDAQSLRVLDHGSNVLFSTPFTAQTWHNFAIQVDWDKLTLQVSYSQNADSLKTVTDVVPNLTAVGGSAGQGDFHFGVLKLPIVNPADSPGDQGDVVHHGIQEGTTEGLLYSGVFVTGQ